MNSILPAELLFTLGPIAVLSLAMAAVAVSYVFLLIKLSKSEKDKAFLQSKIRDQSREILRESHEKGLKIIQDATKKAESLVKQAEIFRDETRSEFLSVIQKISQKEEDLLHKRGEEISKIYEQFFLDLQKDTQEWFKIISKDMENHSLAGIGEFKEALEAEKIFIHKQLETKVDEEYKKIQTQIEDYKLDQMKKVDKKIFDILYGLTRNVLGRSLTLKDHEDLVQKALAQMKLEMESSL